MADINKMAARSGKVIRSDNTIVNEADNIPIYGLSTDTKPSTGLTKGRVFFEIDTTDAYMWDGTKWRGI